MALVQAGDVQLEYFDEGSGDVVAVLIHGAGSSASIWHTVQKELAEGGIRSLAIGTRGAGGSDHTDEDEDYHPSNYAKDLAAAVTELDLPPFVLVGHSLGTLVAAYYIRDNHDQVRGLVQIAGPDPDRQPVEGAAMPQRARAGYGQSLDSVALERWRSQHVGLPDDVRDQLRRDIDNNPPERGRGQRAPWPGLEDVAPNLDVPTMVVLGDADDVVAPAQPLQYYLSLPPEIRHLHVFHGVGHYPPAHVPGRLAGVLTRFIEEHVAAD